MDVDEDDEEEDEHDEDDEDEDEFSDEDEDEGEDVRGDALGVLLYHGAWMLTSSLGTSFQLLSPQVVWGILLNLLLVYFTNVSIKRCLYIIHNIYIYIFVYTCMYAYLYIHICTHTHAYAYVCAYVFIYL